MVDIEDSTNSSIILQLVFYNFTDLDFLKEKKALNVTTQKAKTGI